MKNTLTNLAINIIALTLVVIWTAIIVTVIEVVYIKQSEIQQVTCDRIVATKEEEGFYLAVFKACMERNEGRDDLVSRCYDYTKVSRALDYHEEVPEEWDFRMVTGYKEASK